VSRVRERCGGERLGDGVRYGVFPLGNASGVLMPPDDPTLGGERPRRGGDAIGTRRDERPGSDTKCQLWNELERW